MVSASIPSLSASANAAWSTRSRLSFAWVGIGVSRIGLDNLTA
jgi:hypothetical protein